MPTNPAIDSAAIVTNQKSVLISSFDKVKILVSTHLTKHNVPNLEHLCIDRFYGAELTRLNFPNHRVTPRSELNRLAIV